MEINMIARQNIIILFVLLSAVCRAQNSNITELLPEEIDSVHIALYDVYSKETSTPFSYDPAKDGETEVIHYRMELKDVDRLKKKLKSKKSFNDGRALLYTYNIVFTYFEAGKEVARITISTITGNIDGENQLTNKVSYKHCSKSFGNYLMTLIKKYNMYSLIDESELIGIH